MTWSKQVSVWSSRITAAMAITAIALLALGCGQGGGDGLPIGSPAVINTSIANGAERVSIFAGTNILLTFNTTIDADTAQINDGLGNLTSAIEAVATIGGQPFDKLAGGSAPFLVTVNNLTAGATNTLSITLGFVNGTAGLLPYDAEIRITVLPEIRTFDAANPNQSSNQNLTGTPMGAQFVFTFTTEHDTLTISEVMAVDPDGGAAIPDFIELHNGTAEAISLANYWIAHGNNTSQATQNETLDPVYFNVITQPNVSDTNNTDGTAIFDCGGGDNGEFLARFPAGASVSSGESVVIACDRGDFNAEFGIEPDFELTNESGVPDMLALPNVLPNGTFASRNGVAGRNSIVETTAPNINDDGGYVVVFFLQNTPDATDGIVADVDALGDTSTQLTELANPNLQDVDLVVYGVRPAATDPAIDKSGDLRIEAGNSASSVTFVTEIGKNQQSVPDVAGKAHAAGLSITRKADSLFEFPEFVGGSPGFSNPLLGGFSEIFGTGNGLSQDGNAGGNNKSATANKARIDPTNGQDLAPDERHDETSERLDLTFTTSLAPTPGQ